jgi:hypothetical protein
VKRRTAHTVAVVRMRKISSLVNIGSFLIATGVGVWSAFKSRSIATLRSGCCMPTRCGCGRRC